MLDVYKNIKAYNPGFGSIHLLDQHWTKFIDLIQHNHRNIKSAYRPKGEP